MNNYVDLKALPVDHILRNTPLRELGLVEYSWIGGKTWREFKPTFNAAGCTFNQLGLVWTQSDNWRVSLISS